MARSCYPPWLRVDAIPTIKRNKQPLLESVRLSLPSYQHMYMGETRLKETTDAQRRETRQSLKGYGWAGHQTKARKITGRNRLALQHPQRWACCTLMPLILERAERAQASLVRTNLTHPTAESLGFKDSERPQLYGLPTQKGEWMRLVYDLPQWGGTSTLPASCLQTFFAHALANEVAHKHCHGDVTSMVCWHWHHSYQIMTCHLAAHQWHCACDGQCHTGCLVLRTGTAMGVYRLSHKPPTSKCTPLLKLSSVLSGFWERTCTNYISPSNSYVNYDASLGILYTLTVLCTGQLHSNRFLDHDNLTH